MFTGWSREVLVFILTNSLSSGRVTVAWPLKFWKVIDNIPKIVQDRDSYNGRLIGNHLWPIEWHDCNNICCFYSSVFTHKLESTCGLWFKLYCQKWRTSCSALRSPLHRLSDGTRLQWALRSTRSGRVYSLSWGLATHSSQMTFGRTCFI